MGFLPILDVIGKIVDNVIPDPDKKMDMKIELAKLVDAEAARESVERIAQTEVNKAEAGHRSVFVAGWRPAMGWVGASGLAMYYIVQPAVNLFQGKPLGIDGTELMVLISGMLGFGIQRSFDKLKGTANDVLPMLKPQENAAVPVAAPPKKKKLDLWPF